MPAVLLIAMLFMAPACAEAQSYLVRGGLSSPRGDYGDDSGADAGLAKTGFHLGAALETGLPGSTLGFTLSLDLVSNGADYEVVEEFVGLELDASPYLLVPLVGGPELRFDLAPNVDASVGAGLGMSFFRPGEIDVEDTSVESDFDWSVAFAYGFGAAVDIRRFEVAARYLPSVEFDIEGAATNGDEEEPFSYEQPVAVLLLSVGYRFP